jgi:hypothetical protein
MAKVHRVLTDPLGPMAPGAPRSSELDSWRTTCTSLTSSRGTAGGSAGTMGIGCGLTAQAAGASAARRRKDEAQSPRVVPMHLYRAQGAPISRTNRNDMKLLVLSLIRPERHCLESVSWMLRSGRLSQALLDDGVGDSGRPSARKTRRSARSHRPPNPNGGEGGRFSR